MLSYGHALLDTIMYEFSTCKIDIENAESYSWSLYMIFILRDAKFSYVQYQL